MKKTYVVRSDAGGYWCGLGKWDKQLRKAQIFTSTQFADRVVYRYKEINPTIVEVRLEIVSETPTNADRIRAMSDEELAQAEQDGRLFISPVKVGDMLWPICWDGVLGAWVVDNQPERINEVGSKGFFVAAGYSDPEAPDEFHPYEDIGDRYFQSREEAVAAMAVKEKPEEVQGDG